MMDTKLNLIGIFRIDENVLTGKMRRKEIDTVRMRARGVKDELRY